MPFDRHTVRERPSVGRQESFHVCSICNLSIFFKSYKAHMREHAVMDAQHIAGGQETQMDPTPIRIDSLRATIARLQSKPRLTQGDRDLLTEYDGGLVDLTARLEREQA